MVQTFPRLTLIAGLLLATVQAASAQGAGKAIGVNPIATTSQGGQRWALVIGINDYNNVPDLKFARQDAEALAKTLVERCGFPRDQVVLMTDARDIRINDPGRYPTRSNLRNRINRLSEIVGRNDVLLIVYSGHGVNLDGKGYLVPVDGASKDVSSLIPLQWVKTTLETSAATQRLLILDACHAAAKAGPGDSSAGALNAIVSGAAFQTLASCDSQELSHEDPATGHGVFATALLEGLAGSADAKPSGNADGVISSDELFDYAALHVKRWSFKSGQTQTPVLKGERRGRVELVRYSRIDTQTIAPPPPAWRPTPPTSPVTPPRPSGPSKIGDTITNSIGMKLTYIPAGEFLMGSPASEEGRSRDETQHRVKISKPFLLGVTEVAQGQYAKVMGKNPSYFKGSDALPVEQVSWHDAVAFCRKLSQKEGRTYRLPTESEWEYACRAGSTSRYSFGDSDSALGSYGWYGDYRGNANKQTHAVGQKKPNAWGLYDMHGNVWEWCSDWYGEDYPSGLVTDPAGASSGTSRVLRGGSWSYGSRYCRAAIRDWVTPDYRNYNYGFRVVCVLPRPGLSE